MSNVLTFIALGLTTGALYGIAAQGMVAIYRGSGVINFAHGAMALLSAAIFVALRNHLDTPALLAAAIGIGASALCGLGLDLFILRRIRHASPLAKIVVTLALLGMIESVVIAFSGSNLKFVDSFLPTNPVNLGLLIISADRLLLCLIAATITGALWAVYRYTDFGRQTAAVTENPRIAAALGISPNSVSQLNWGLGAALAGLSGILLAPLTGLMASTMVMLINPVLAAALIGRFSSFPLALTGGLLIGLIQSLLNMAGASSGWAAAVPFLVIIGVLIARGQALPTRGFVSARLPSVTAATGFNRYHGIAALIACGLIFILSEDLLAAFTTSMLAAIILLSIIILTGMAGQLSLGQYAFAGIGAFVSARLADVYQWPFSISFVAAISVAVLSGLLFALPALRTRGVNLAIATLGLGLALDSLVFKNKYLTGGFAGTNIDAPTLFGVSFDAILYPERFALMVLGLLLLCTVMAINLRRSASGRALLAIRGNEQAAASLGISVVRCKLYAFALAAGMAASAGVLMAFRFPSVRFDAGYSAFESIPAVLMAFLGGIGFIYGALLGGLISLGGVMNELMATVIDLHEWMPFAFGVAAIAMVLQSPNGLASLLFSTKTARHQPVTSDGSTAIECPRKTLYVENLSVRFGGVQALSQLSFSATPNQVLGLIGPNGAGKTTALDAISGFSASNGGTLRLDDTDISHLPPAQRAQRGLSRSFQSVELFDDLSVAEHLRCAWEQSQAKQGWRDLFCPKQAPLPEWLYHVAKVFGLDSVLSCLPHELSFGQRRLLGIARAVATRPAVLLLDEPAAGLDSTESRELGQLIQTMARKWGMAIVLIEHDMNLVMTYCDHVVVLDFGETIATGSPAAVQQNPAVISAYLGQTPEPPHD